MPTYDLARQPAYTPYTQFVAIEDKKGIDQLNQDEAWITIFVHGMLNIVPHLNCKNICLFLQDNILDTLYAHTVHYIRENPFFYTNDGMGPLGLTELNIHDLRQGMVGNVSAYIYNEMCRLVGLPYRHNHYFTYGWSGLCSMAQRYIEAEDLLLDIDALVQKYTCNTIKPKVRIIGYSHGGNISLNLAAVHQAKYPEMDISIDELILVGLPVQHETDSLVCSPLFKKIYHFYSRLDRIQQLDPFSTHFFFSRQQFESRNSFTIPDKLTQVQIKCSRARARRQKQNPACVRRVGTSNRAGQRRSMRDASPGHIELWFFQWTIGNYRDTFPLAPLPVLSFIPYMIVELQKIEDYIHRPRPIIFDLRPEFDVAVIKQHFNSELCEVVPFIHQDDLEPLHALAYDVQADDYDTYHYQKHLEYAFSRACSDHMTKNTSARVSKKTRRRKLHTSPSGYTAI